jgi:hypothetical protein
MVTPYITWTEAELDASTWQGIQYLSFNTTEPGFAAVVTVHLARPNSGITAASLLLENEAGIQDLIYEVRFPVDPLLIEVGFPTRGNYARYTIRLINGGDDLLHPFFDRASFSFYIDCPAGDCRPPRFEADAIAPKHPVIDLQTKDYKGFMQVLGDWIKVSNPAWSDLSPASFERMLTEVLCHHADFLSYYQDRVANEAFIETARNRHSLRQHGLLLGYELNEGKAATTTLALNVINPGVIPQGVAVELRGLPGETPLTYVTSAPVRLDPAWNAGEIIPAAWPRATNAMLPPGATGMLLWNHDLNLSSGQAIALIQGSTVEIVTLVSVEEITSPGWVEDPALLPAVAPANLTRVTWTPATTHPIYPWAAQPSPFLMRGNLVPAVYGLPRRAVVGSSLASDSQAVEIALIRRNSIVTPQTIGVGDPVYLLRALQVPEGPVVFEADATEQLRPALQVWVDGELWSRQPHLWESQSYDRHYVAETDNSGCLWLQFGDGTRGREIRVTRNSPVEFTATTPIEIHYRIGMTNAGNCARETLNRIVPQSGTTAALAIASLVVTQVTNILPGQGGYLPESLNAARFAIPASLQHAPLARAVTLTDYANAAMAVPGVARAAAVNLGGIFNTVLVLVDPTGQSELSPQLQEQVNEQIDRLRMAGREHRVAPPTYVALEVQLILCAANDALRQHLRERVLAALRPGTAQQPGFFHPDRLSFGEDLELGDLLAYVQTIPGVRSTKALVFRRLNARQDNCRVWNLIELAPTEVARLDGDENRPENGVLKVFVVGLDDLDKIREDLSLSADEELFKVAVPVLETLGGTV